MIRVLLLLLCCGWWSNTAQAQFDADTLRVSSDEAEAIFLQRNLRLLAERLQISEAEARLIQARLWPNPTISVGEINLWSNHGSEQLGRLTGTWGNTSQIAVDVEQLIQTAGKRRKLLEMEEVGIARAEVDFEETLRSLKLEFRNQFTTLHFTQQRLVVYERQLAFLQQLLAGYRHQLQQGNVSRREYLRLRAVEIEFLQSISEIKKDNLAAQREAKVLMGIPAQQALVLVDELSVPPVAEIRLQSPLSLVERALENRADLKAVELESTYAAKRLTYERAMRVPDLTVGVNYDRGGNIMRDFVGIGVAMDLPVFNRNQGSIRSAQLGKARSQLMLQDKKNEVGSHVVNAWNELLLTLDIYDQLETDYEGDLDRMQESYHHRFASRDISLLEYLDFLEAYLSSKDAMMEMRRDLHLHYEQLNYAVGGQLH